MTPPAKAPSENQLVIDQEAVITRLKARAYDLIAANERIQAELQQVNNQIAAANQVLRKQQEEASTKKPRKTDEQAG